MLCELRINPDSDSLEFRYVEPTQARPVSTARGEAPYTTSWRHGAEDWIPLREIHEEHGTVSCMLKGISLTLTLNPTLTVSCMLKGISECTETEKTFRYLYQSMP